MKSSAMLSLRKTKARKVGDPSAMKAASLEPWFLKHT